MGDPVGTRWVAGLNGHSRGAGSRLRRVMAGLAAAAGRAEVWGAALAGGLGLLLLAEMAPEVRAPLPPAAMAAERGLAYVTSLPPLTRFPFRVRGAQVYAPPVGRLILLEDGFPVGPDAPHDTIRQEGGGAFSVWGQALYLSASDGSDPRTNGRVYAVAGRAGLDPALRSLALVLLGLAAVGWTVAAVRGPGPGPPRVVLLAGWATAGLGALGLLACLGAAVLSPTRSGVLDPAAIARGPQLAYQALIREAWDWPWRVLLEDTVTGGTLSEGGTALGPIAADPGLVAAEGGGRYWRDGSRLVFSSSDGTDARTGDRRYAWSVPVEVRGLAWLASLALLLAGAVLGVPGRVMATLAWLGGRGTWAPPGRLAFLMRWGSPGDRLCDAAIVALALWTLSAHAVVVAGGGLGHLVGLYALAAALLGAGLVGRLRRSPPGPSGWAAESAEEPRDEPPGRLGPGLGRAGVLAAALLVVADFAWRPDAVRLWWSALALLLAGAVTTLAADQPRVRPAPNNWASERALWLLAAACVALSLVAHRPDADDSFYVNLAVAVADEPGQALYEHDTLHGIPGLPLHLPVYRVHSYEILNGAVAYLTGLPAVYVFHWLSAAAGALLLPLAHARLFRVLLPGHWLGAVAVLTAVLVAAGDANHWYGNLALVRIWQGKPLFLVVVLPLIQAYALRFAARPTWGGWLMLAASQVAAVGCTSTALWVGPAAALLALASALRPSARGLSVLVLGALASAYVVGVGWVVRASVGSVLEGSIRQRVTAWGGHPGSSLLEALVVTLGDYRLLLFGIGCVVAAWALAPAGLARRFAVVAPLGALLGPLNPYVFSWVAGHVSGPTYWRTMWLVPVPILMTLVLTAPLHLEGRWRPQWRSAACLLLLGAFILLVPRQAGLGPGNSVRLAWPGLKVSPAPYRWAALVNASVPPGSVVAGPPEVANLVVTFHHHAFPLAVRSYLAPHGNLLDREMVDLRRQVQDWLAQPEGVEGAPRRFREGLDRLAVRAVCLARSGRAGAARAVLQQAGFRQTVADQDYELWVRSGSGQGGEIPPGPNRPPA